MLLTKEQILTAPDLPFEDVPVTEWSGTVRVRVMTGADRDALAASMRDAAGNLDPSKYQVRLLARCLVDEAGAMLFTDAELDALNGKNAAVLDRVYKVADKLNGTAANAVDNAEKN